MAELAAAINAPEASVTTVCTALVALGALRRDGTRVRLSAAWAPLAHGGLDVLLERTLQGPRSGSA
jgi:DNA-binding IclR family transcriptional regulator